MLCKKQKYGEYVRTDEGIIQKCTDIDNAYIYADGILSYNFQGDVEIPNSYIEKTRIVKHSKNIIDLIKERRLCKQIRSIQKQSCKRKRKITSKKSYNKWHGFRNSKY